MLMVRSIVSILLRFVNVAYMYATFGITIEPHVVIFTALQQVYTCNSIRSVVRIQDARGRGRFISQSYIQVQSVWELLKTVSE